MDQSSADHFLLEVCVGSVDDARHAELRGADRLELCGALELGGLTPSFGLIEQVVSAVNLPVMVMIRPRAAGFCYSDGEFGCMLRDVELTIAAGASGVVFGVLDENSAIDPVKVERLVEAAGPLDTVFHRAFDFVRDPLASLETLIELDVSRVLTTGGKATANEGIEMLSRLVEQAAERIQIMPAGGVSGSNVTRLIAATRCRQVHSGSAETALDPSIPADGASSLCDLQRLSEGQHRMVDPTKVASLRQALDN